jgi:RimJ/RimL family protein N-acetyltransferase
MGLELDLWLSPASIAKLIVRPLRARDGRAYRCLRQRILDIGEGKYFSSSYAREKKFSRDADWEEWCTETQDHCTFGTFLGDELIGIMGIVAHGKRSDATVEWEATWLHPRYRRYGIAKVAYKEVFRWTILHDYQRAIVLIREDNERSRSIREKQGAIFSHSLINEVWADGSIANVDVYTFDLSRANMFSTTFTALAA